jgi:hypothetical protein
MSKIRDEFKFLNLLRESGATNMYGATPYLMDAYNIGRREASKILMEWMQWANQNPKNLNR